jgi:hypothetical protein
VKPGRIPTPQGGSPAEGVTKASAGRKESGFVAALASAVKAQQEPAMPSATAPFSEDAAPRSPLPAKRGEGQGEGRALPVHRRPLTPTLSPRSGEREESEAAPLHAATAVDAGGPALEPLSRELARSQRRRLDEAHLPLPRSNARFVRALEEEAEALAAKSGGREDRLERKVPGAHAGAKDALGAAWAAVGESLPQVVKAESTARAAAHGSSSKERAHAVDERSPRPTNEPPPAAAPAHAPEARALETASAPPPPLAHPAQGDAAAPPPVLHAPPAPPLPPEAAPMMAHVADDPSLRLALAGGGVRLALEREGGEDLSLHLRLKEGSADVRVGGALAPLIEARVPEMQAALAGAGLSLASFDRDDGRHQPPAPRADEDSASASRAPGAVAAPTASPPSPAPHGAGRIHVTA